MRPFSGAYENEIKGAVESLSGTGDKRIHLVDTTGWLDKEKGDFIDGIHPGGAGSLKAGRFLANALEPWLDQ